MCHESMMKEDCHFNIMIKNFKHWDEGGFYEHYRRRFRFLEGSPQNEAILISRPRGRPWRYHYGWPTPPQNAVNFESVCVSPLQVNYFSERRELRTGANRITEKKWWLTTHVINHVFSLSGRAKLNSVTENVLNTQCVTSLRKMYRDWRTSLR